MNPNLRALRALFASLVVLSVLLVWSLAALQPRSSGKEVGISEVPRLVEGGQLSTLTVLAEDDRIVGELIDGSRIWAAYPASGSSLTSLLSQLAPSNVQVRVDQQAGKETLGLLAQFVLPLLVLANLFGIFILLTRGGTGQVRDLFAFSRVGAQRAEAVGSNPYRFGNVAAIDSVVEELGEIASYLREPLRFSSMGALPPKGVLLSGPPGCGKTLLARALAGEVGVPFYFISGSEFVESLVGVGAARVRDLFRQAVANAPALIFIDELDAAGRRRGTGVGGGHDEREQTLNELLVQMDGFSPSAGVVVIGATNRPDILDPALLRPGRFDRHIVVEAPDVDGRAEILELHAHGRRLADDVDLDAVAHDTPGCTGADLANIMNEAALLAVRRGSTAIVQADLVEAVQRTVSGAQRQRRALTEDEVQRLSVHEAGHVVVSAALRPGDRVQRASIVARGADLAHTDIRTRSDRVVATRADLLADLAIVMSGVAAEQLELGDVSTAGASDLERATALARDFAGRLGMSDEVGRLRVFGPESEVFLGRELAGTNHAAPSTMEAVDVAVRRLIDEAEAQASSILRQRRAVLRRVATALVDEETLDEGRVEDLLAGGRNGRAQASEGRRRSGAPAARA